MNKGFWKIAVTRIILRIEISYFHWHVKKIKRRFKMNVTEMLEGWKSQASKSVKTATFRNYTEANIFISQLRNDFISAVKSRSGIIVTYYSK
jgi:hypothetical protein